MEFDKMPEELQKLYIEYYALFGMFPFGYGELNCFCSEAFDVELIKEAIEKKIELPILILGEDYLDSNIDY